MPNLNKPNRDGLISFKAMVSRGANLWHFIASLTDWHFSARPEYKREWLQKTGSLSFEEEEVLNKIVPVFRKYMFGRNYWGKTFLLEPEEKVWNLAQERFDQNSIKVFREVAESISPRFEKLWPEEEILLENWLERLRQTQSLGNPPGLIEDLNTFFGAEKNPDGSTKILLLMSVKSNFPNGGANLKPEAVTLEISRLPLDFVRPAWLTIWHELIHCLWENNRYSRLIDKVAKELRGKKVKSPVNGVPLRTVINEAVMVSLFPTGYLAKKHFGFPVDEYFHKMLAQGPWRDQLASRLMDLSGRCIEEGRQIGRAYLNQVIEVVGNL